MELKSECAGQAGPPVQATAPPGTNCLRDILIVLAVSLAARILFMLLMPSFVQSTDAQNWKNVMDTLKAGVNPYQPAAAINFNWPPFWLQILFVLSKISDLLSISLFRVIQIFLVVTESVVIVLLVKLIREVVPQARLRALVILGIALNPAAILLICQHCNFDIIVALWVVLFLLNLLKYDRTGDAADWLAACLFLGLGILTKTVPFILTPLLAGGFKRVTGLAKFLGLMLLFGPATLGMSVVYVLSPANVTAHVINYRSIGGDFGISGLLHLAGVDQFTSLYNLLFDLVLLAGMLGAGVLFWRRRCLGNRETVLLAALFLAFVPALGPGYAPQYLYWYLPLLVATWAFYPGWWRAVLAGFGLIVAGTYLFEYAVLGADGASLINIVYYVKQDQQEAVALVKMFGKYQFPPGQTMMRLPLFLAYLALLSTGAGILFKNLKNQSNSDAPAARETYLTSARAGTVSVTTRPTPPGPASPAQAQR